MRLSLPRAPAMYSEPEQQVSRPHSALADHTDCPLSQLNQLTCFRKAKVRRIAQSKTRRGNIAISASGAATEAIGRQDKRSAKQGNTTEVKFTLFTILRQTQSKARGGNRVLPASEAATEARF